MSYNPMNRPCGSNADEWCLFLTEHINAPEFLAVQIAEAIEAAARRVRVKKLPSAGFLVRFEWWEKPMWTKFRLANAMQLHLGRLVVRWRMPWLDGPARQLHPECFK